MFFKLKIFLIKIYLFFISLLILLINSLVKPNIILQQKNLVNWILAAQKANNTFGISKGYSYLEKKSKNRWYREYPETTGYLIPSLLNLSVKKNLFPYNNILLIADWLLSIQKTDGSFKGGLINSEEESSIFDTGQIIKGMYSLYKYNKIPKYLNSALRASNWILKSENQKNGNWSKFGTKALNSNGLTFNIYAIDIIAEIGIEFSNINYLNLSNRVGEFTISKIKENMWVEGCELSYINYPVSHTLAYTVEGLYNLGLLLNNNDFKSKSLKILNVLIQKINNSGYLPGYYDRNWNDLNFGSCLTGSAQIGCLCIKVYKSTGNTLYLLAAKKLYKYLSLRLNNYFQSFGGAVGSMPGSWPINGRYFSYASNNWTIKYMIDFTFLIEEYL